MDKKEEQNVEFAEMIFAKDLRGHLRPEVWNNLCWGILGGWVMFVYFISIGIVYGLTLIGYKKAYACFKCALFALMPFGRNVATAYTSHLIGNTFWVFTTGWQICLYCLVLSALFYLTYFGRYLGAKWFHLSQFALAPFGARFRKTDLLNGQESALAGLRNREKEYEL